MTSNVPAPAPAPGYLTTISGSLTHVVIDGAGPPVVLSSGLAGSWFDWDAVVQLLSSDHTVIRMDRPGYGLSAPRPDGVPLTVVGEAARFVGLLDHLGLERAVIAGHSMSSFYLEAFGRLYPERCAGLVFLDGSVVGQSKPRLPRELRAQIAGGSATLGTWLRLPTFGPWLRRKTVGQEPGMRHSDEERALVQQVMASPGYMRTVIEENALYRSLAADVIPIRSAHPALRVPMVVARADRGRWSPLTVPWKHLQRQYAAALGAEYVVITHSGHSVMIHQPGQVVDAIRRVTGVTPRGRVVPPP